MLRIVSGVVSGLVAGAVCCFTATRLKRWLRHHDSFDVHAVADTVGALLTGPLASASLGGFGNVAGMGGQLWTRPRVSALA
ncbi:MAG: hypothetical protein ABI268_08905 [Rhodanobacter sp.]